MEYTNSLVKNSPSSQPQQQQEQWHPCYKFKFNLPASEPEIFLRFETNGRGGGHRAKFHKVRDVYVDAENRIHAGYKPNGDGDKSGRPYQYTVIGKLQVLGGGLS